MVLDDTWELLLVQGHHLPPTSLLRVASVVNKPPLLV